MSLLMDALKKAEQEKKEAAKQRELPNESGMSLEQRDASENDSQPIQQPQAPELPSTDQQSPTDEAQSLDFSLEPLDAGVDLHEADSESKPGEPGISEESKAGDIGEITNTMEIPQQPDQPAALEITGENATLEPQTELPPDPDQTFHGVDLEKTFNSALYEDTVQGEPFKPEEFAKSYDETLPGVPAAQLARDIGTEDQPTPVAAQTIFTATNTIAKPTSGFRWLLVGLAALAVLSALVASYFFITPVNRSITSPLVARGIETVITTPNISPPANQAIQQSNIPAQLDDIEGEITTTTEISSAQSDGETVDSADESEDSPVANDANATEDIIDDEINLLGQAIDTQPQIAEALPEVIEPPSSLIQITKSVQSEPNNQLLQEAFAAFQSEDYATAQLKYSDALTQLPDNRDALLGMAAVSIKTGRQAQAMEYYIRILRANPLDSIARAAILGQQSGNTSMSSISALKSMVSELPDHPFLYFSLGKLYARRAEWPAAQQAFFDAYRLDTTNPDFALNLAISLDRIGQNQAALDYYNVALSLSESNPANFQRSEIQNRIDTLNRGN